MESSDNKVMGILSYLSILVLIPILVGDKSRYVKFHANQGLVLSLLLFATGILSFITYFIPLIGGLLRLMLKFIQFGIIVLDLLGIVNVIQDNNKELPFIGGIKILN